LSSYSEVLKNIISKQIQEWIGARVVQEDYNDVKWTREREKVEQRQHRDRKEIETEAGMRREEKRNG
jgi:hypothetical protein